MTETKKQSNPFSTGGGGVNFETRVQAAFTILMLSGQVSPCLPPYSITKIKLQGRYDGFKTDDFIVFTQDSHTGKQAKLLAQIKHDISITKNDDTFGEVIVSAWTDFNDDNFVIGEDALALITASLSKTDTNHVRPILEWARHSENKEEFLKKINTKKFTSKTKKEKLSVFREKLTAANNDKEPSNKELWEFLKSFHLIGYDLDTASGSTLSLIYSVISLYSDTSAMRVWTSVLDAVQIANQNAGTVTLKTLPKEVQEVFATTARNSWSLDINKLKEHGSYILEGIRNTIGSVHIEQPELILELLNLTESSNFILVSGERGTGKSSLVRTFSKQIGDNTPIFCLRAEDLDKPHLDDVFSALRLKASISDLEARFALMPKKYLILESLEKILELENTAAFTDLLQLVNKSQGWTVIATCRDYAYQQITFQYLQPFGVDYKSLSLFGFDDDDIFQLCEKLPSLKNLVNNQALKDLLKIPFFADLAFRVVETGTEFSSKDGEKEFRVAVWRDVIAKEQERTNGMPVRRKQTFIDIAVKRAKLMVYGVPDNEFDGDVVLKLEEDHLIRRDSSKNIVIPAHDVLEDWALEQFIETTHLEHSGDLLSFIKNIGHEPAISRAYRLWLQQKIKEKVHIHDFVKSILLDQDIQSYCQDETISAILNADNPDEFLGSLKSNLFENDNALLKRFCFVLRIVCKVPSPDFPPKNESGQTTNTINTLFLIPHGEGWNSVIRFLYRHKTHLSESFIPHVAALLNDWSSLLKIDEKLLGIAREAGLLALHLLTTLKESYGDDEEGNRKILLSIIIKTSSVIQSEFIELLERDVFVARSGKRRSHRPHYVDDFCKLMFSYIESAYLCNYHPDLLIRLAKYEWFSPEETQLEEDPFYSERLEVADCFGLYEYRYKFFPPSGLRGPFHHLLRYHPRKGLDFIIDILNKAGEKYAYSDLDSEHTPGDLHTGYSEPQIEQLEIQLNDGSSVNQYISGRLWLAYRGHSVVPYLLQCALMALENWLISIIEDANSDTIDWLFDYILKRSNTVMSTAVLASVATGYPKMVGKSSIPLLRDYRLYSLDLARTIQERGEHETNWFGSGLAEEFTELYTQERRTAALRAWRKEHLEGLIVQLQFSEFHDEAIKTIDYLKNLASSKYEKNRFMLHRIDSRAWKAIKDTQHNRITFEAKGLEPDLKEIQHNSQIEQLINNRFSTLFLWARKTFKKEPLDDNYYDSWQDTLTEAKELLSILKKGNIGELRSSFAGGIVTASAIFIRDYSTYLLDEDIEWCIELIVSAVVQNVDTEDYMAMGDVTDYSGSAACASILPILFDHALEQDHQLFIKELIVKALTHVNENIRHHAANGIREYLWSRNPKFAQNCIVGAIEYARFEKETRPELRQSFYNENRESVREGIQARKDKFRDDFIKSRLTLSSKEVSLDTHSVWHILSPCLMVPDGSRQKEHIGFLSQMLAMFYQAEQCKHSDENSHLKYQVASSFSSRFSTHLFQMSSSDFIDYIDQLKTGCEVAPKFINYLILCVAVEAESNKQKEVYWSLWGLLSNKVQELAIEVSHLDSDYRRRDERRDLIRGMLSADINWQKIDLENQEIAYGKELLLTFVKNAGKNPDVFEALSKLIHYFPSIFFETGIHVLAKHQKTEGGARLLSGINTSFYLERAIQRFLQFDQTGALSRRMHESCYVLLDAVVDTASSQAYYLREHLIRSRRILI